MRSTNSENGEWSLRCESIVAPILPAVHGYRVRRFRAASALGRATDVASCCHFNRDPKLRTL